MQMGMFIMFINSLRMKILLVLTPYQLYILSKLFIINVTQGFDFFRYDLSPIVVSFYQKKEPFFHFLVQLCAIIGGVFTVAGIIDGIFHKSIKTLLKKAEINKLS